MTISQLDVYQFSIPLKLPIIVKGEKTDTRQGLLIKLTASSGCAGWGEVSPLPGLSLETFEDALAQIQALKRELIQNSIPSDVERLEDRFEGWWGPLHLFPSVRFGCEMAVLNLLADEKKVYVAQLIGHSYQSSVFLSGLLQGPKDIVVNQAENMKNRGFRSLKLKVGSPHFMDDVEKVELIKAVTKGHATLRLDANQAWDYETAVRFCQTIGPEQIEYIEEPCHHLSLHNDFFPNARIPIALDETVQIRKGREFRLYKGLKAIVLKPTILGGVEKTFAWIRKAQKENIQPVISSSFESGVGLIFLVNMAASCAAHVPAGLDTLKWFEFDVLGTRLTINQGFLNIDKINLQRHDINFEVVEPVNQ